MNPNSAGTDELDDIMQDLIVGHNFDYAREAFQAWKDREVVAAEKAYGGCHLCYGKGYASQVGYHRVRNMSLKQDPMKFCTCERGKQLEQCVAQLQRQDGDGTDTNHIAADSKEVSDEADLRAELMTSPQSDNTTPPDEDAARQLSQLNGRNDPQAYLMGQTKTPPRTSPRTGEVDNSTITYTPPDEAWLDQILRNSKWGDWQSDDGKRHHGLVDRPKIVAAILAHFDAVGADGERAGGIKELNSLLGMHIQGHSHTADCVDADVISERLAELRRLKLQGGE